ncbi:cytochrome c biogenesis CcdA family protein [Amycolatopsis aidingensis]|uniref:cytochrome c biogenesis CcdA family protein n=1 Tax=Amycolatopsis aidingensis TaxID=2842453 RepID=UPI001C0B0AF9|nr:cytochrome c biogenesis protein CcdA [Amycolatopsis aidingensis]
MEFLTLACLALVAGLVSFASPCTLPLLPGYVSYVSGLSAGPAPAPARRVLTGALLFVVGFSAVFTTLGATASALGFLLASNLRVINLAGGTLIVLMGLTLTGLVRIPLLHRQLRFDLARVGRGPAGALPLGAAFAFGWTPCVGPVLASILATAASTGTVGRGTLLLLAYSLGLGVPFLVLATGLARGRMRIGWLQRHARRIEIAGGVILVAMGIAVLTGGWTVLMSRLLGLYAQLGWPPI